jgi:ubiquinone/menaquinone biosynthesis C-methylase UbiE
VRFVRGLPDEAASIRALDIGCGGGRHTLLLAREGYEVDAVDISEEGLRHTAAALTAAGVRASLVAASMTELPFGDGTFDVAVSYGVFYYGTLSDGCAAVDELWRVLRPGGRAFAVVRTDRDYRAGKGVQVERGTYRLEVTDTNEFGTVQHFLSEDDVQAVYGAFSSLAFELSETTFADRSKTNSDWLVSVIK